MEMDPIAENQTNVMIAKLTTRTDGDVELNHAVAALLSASQRQARELVEIKSSLWSPDALDNRIVSKHSAECNGCTVRKWVEDYRKKLATEAEDQNKPSLWSFLLSERGLLVIVVILFALMCARQILGPQGYRDVTTTMRTGAEK